MLDQAEFLRGHPIFTTKSPSDMSLVLSLNNLPSFKESRSSSITLERGTRNGAGRRRIMALRESDLLLSVGNEIRITSLFDANTFNLQQRSYKVYYVHSTLHAPLTHITSIHRHYIHRTLNSKYDN
jgi:nucleoporin NUP82